MLKILFIEPEHSKSVKLYTQLYERGYDLLFADTFTSVVRTLFDGPSCSLIVTDLNLPSFNAITFKKFLRQTPLCKVPIILYTAELHKINPDTDGLGLYAVLEKPTDEVLLTHYLQEAKQDLQL